MASNKPGHCCTVGVKHEGEPEGQIVKLDGKWDAYIATPPADKSHKGVGILYLSDVLGVWKNSQLLCDQFAANGYHTLMPDLFNGDSFQANVGQPGFDMMKWFREGSDGKNPHTEKEMDEIVEAAIKSLKEKHGIERLGAAGYCVGAKQVVRHYKDGIDVGFAAHPSWVTEEELEAISGPLSIAAAETDSIFTADLRHKSEEILKRTAQPYQVNLYSGTTHGFAVRSDLSKPDQRFAKEQAFIQACQWFDYYLLEKTK